MSWASHFIESVQVVCEDEARRTHLRYYIMSSIEHFKKYEQVFIKSSTRAIRDADS